MNVTPLDHLTRVGPLGVRFWDPVEQRFVANGLVVNVRLAASQVRIAAQANPTAIFTAQGLPFLRVAEGGAGDDAYWAHVTTRSFVVEVADPLGRFVPFSFPAQLPTRRLFVWSCPFASPPSFHAIADGVPLFSAATRGPASMRAVLRADLQDAVTGGPAAGAVLVATVDGTLVVTGIADAQGHVAIHFAYPEPRDFPAIEPGSPPPGTGASLAGYAWPVVLSAQYAPVTTPYPLYPDLCTTLHQPAATLLRDSTGAPLPAQVLQMGVELVLRSEDAVSGLPLSVLLVQRT